MCLNILEKKKKNKSWEEEKLIPENLEWFHFIQSPQKYFYLLKLKTEHLVNDEVKQPLATFQHKQMEC